LGSREHIFELGQILIDFKKVHRYINATHTCFSTVFRIFFVSGRPSSCCGHLELKIILCASHISRPRLSSSFVVVVVVLGRVLRFVSGCRRRRRNNSSVPFVACYSRLFFCFVGGLD
jgi:hypothetical protein